MDQTIIGELNQKYRIYFPYEEISIYLQDSTLNDSPLPVFSKLFITPASFYPTKISFKSRSVKEGFPPDNRRSLIEFKRDQPKVSFQKLELLYMKNFLANNSVGPVSSRCAIVLWNARQLNLMCF